MDESELEAYVNWLRKNGKSVATVSRSIASIKSFYGFLASEGIIDKNPSVKLVPDKTTQKLPQILTSKEVELLLEQPECVDMKGYRDRAMLELLYATGIRAASLYLWMSLTSTFRRNNPLPQQGKERAIPLYPAAIRALSEYIEFIRPQMISTPEEKLCQAESACRVRASGRLSSHTRPRRV